MEATKTDKEKYEKELVKHIKEIGIEKHYEMDDEGLTHHKFLLKDGAVKYWTNMSETNLNKLGL